jgi:NADH:ubiquinone oxidoreductase subunit 5 (subunit L)/multisubunit Na+/H+ antiporter MnhA subunit
MKVLLYVLTSVAILCAIPPFGYYFSIIVDINQCSPATYDSSKLSSVFAIATVLFVLLLVFFVLLFLAFCTASEEKYREVSRHHT